jgi:hypothetical protein
MLGKCCIVASRESRSKRVVPNIRIKTMPLMRAWMRFGRALRVVKLQIEMAPPGAIELK